MKLTQKQETFCLKYFELGNATEAAIAAGYSSKTAVKIASENLTKLDIVARLRELREAVNTDTIATVKKRKEVLTGIADGEHKEPITARERIQAIAELNKMERVYEEGIKVNIDNRTVEIIVTSDTAKKLTEAIIKGEGTE